MNFVRSVKYVTRALGSKRKSAKQFIYLCPNKMGSTTFGRYFATKGYSVYHGVAWRHRLFWTLNRKFDVLCDGLPTNVDDFISSLPPESIIVVGRRDRKAWVKSRLAHVNDNSKKWIYSPTGKSWGTDEVVQQNWSKLYLEFYSEVYQILSKSQIEWYSVDLDENDKDSMVRQLDNIFEFHTNSDEVIANSAKDRRKILLYEKNSYHFETLCSVLNKWPTSQIEIYAPNVSSNRGRELINAALQRYSNDKIVSTIRITKYDEVYLNTFDSASGCLMAFILTVLGCPFSGLVHNYKFLNTSSRKSLSTSKRLFSIFLIRLSVYAKCLYTLSSDLDHRCYQNRNIQFHDMMELKHFQNLSNNTIDTPYCVIIGGYSQLKKDYSQLLDTYVHHALQYDLHFLGEYSQAHRFTITEDLKSEGIRCYFYDQLGDLDLLRYVSESCGILDINRVDVYGIEKVSAQEYLARVYGLPIYRKGQNV